MNALSLSFYMRLDKISQLPESKHMSHTQKLECKVPYLHIYSLAFVQKERLHRRDKVGTTPKNIFPLYFHRLLHT